MNILKLFADSSFAPIQHHSELIKNGVTLLNAFLETALEQEWEKASKLVAETNQVLNDASELYNEIVRQLPLKHTPFLASGELYALLTEQKSILFNGKKNDGFALSRKMIFPEALKESYQGFIQAALNATQVAKETVDELEGLAKEGWLSPKRKLLNNNLQALHQFENEAAKIYQEMMAALLKLEEKLQPLDSLFLYQLLEGAHSIITKAQRVGGRVQLLIA